MKLYNIIKLEIIINLYRKNSNNGEVYISLHI